MRCIRDLVALFVILLSFASNAQISAVGATASTYYPGYPPSAAIDGSSATAWIANGFPYQWIELDLGAEYPVSLIKALTTQSPDGSTSHGFWGRTAGGSWHNYGSVYGYTTDSQWVEMSATQASVRYVYVETNASPSWVGWREIQVFQNAPNNPPSVTLVTPAQGGTKPAQLLGSSITLTSTAYDDGGVMRVDYYANGGFIGTSSSAPYSVSFTPTTAGVYNITARAYDFTYQSTYSGAGSVAFMRLVPVVEPGSVSSPIFIYDDFGTGILNQWYVAVRRTAQNAVAAGLNTDFSTVDGVPSCPHPAGASCTLTNFSTPLPRTTFQRGQVDGTPNVTSGFQQYDSHVGSFLNTFESGCVPSPAGNAHSVYEFRPNPHLVVFDGHAQTELVLQFDLEVPWLHHAGSGARVQISVAAYFTKTSDPSKAFGVLINAYDNVTFTPPAVYSDGFFGFISTPFAGNNDFMSIFARNGQYVPTFGPMNTFSTGTWKGLAGYRAFVSREKLLSQMSALGFGGNAPEDFRLSSISILHEHVNCSASVRASSAYHAANLRVYSARYAGQ